jgi:hypothetical protein
MAIDQRSGTKVIKNLRREEAGATRVDPYPYIGIVKNNLDPTRSGRLQVYIPDFGGDPDIAQNWRTVSYASPFMGYTTSRQSSKDPVDYANEFESVTHTYGMWAVPPDIGVQVLVLFIAGDPLRGYWLACVNPNLSHHMLPAIAGSTNVDLNSASGADVKTFRGGYNIPVAEFNDNVKDFSERSNFYNLPKPIHKIQYGILKTQGLDRDPIRGSISSSSQRETPSHVFGISTPGRPLNDPADDINYVTKLYNNTLPPDYFKIKSRKGGHTFVMDDGATLGQDQLVRLRTAKGHQLIMHDTDNSVYLAHADGSSWIEMTNDGQIKIYASNGLSIRSEGTINLHSDANMNFNADGDIKFKAEGGLQFESGRTTLLSGSLSVTANQSIQFKTGSSFAVDAGGSISYKAQNLYAVTASQILHNSGGEIQVSAVPPLRTNKYPNSVFNSGLGLWINTPNLLDSIVTVAPTHEPYTRNIAPFFAAVSGQTPQATYQGSVDAIKNLKGTGVTNTATDKSLRDQPNPSGTVGNLDKNQLKAYMAQIGKSESGGDYTAVNRLGYVGKYQFGYQALIDGGYVKSSVTSLAQLDNPNSWTGKDGITDKNTWLNNPSVQESAMLEYTQRNYSAMVNNGAITADMPPEEVGGMLSVAHLLGPNKGTSDRPGALGWRQGLGGSDANGTTGDSYFQKGKYAVSVLAPKIDAIDAG